MPRGERDEHRSGGRDRARRHCDGALRTRAYSAVIGSGTSSVAGSPTVWTIVEDLGRGIAAVEGADASDDPIIGTGHGIPWGAPG